MHATTGKLSYGGVRTADGLDVLGDSAVKVALPVQVVAIALVDVRQRRLVHAERLGQTDRDL